MGSSAVPLTKSQSGFHLHSSPPEAYVARLRSRCTEQIAPLASLRHDNQPGQHDRTAGALVRARRCGQNIDGKHTIHMDHLRAPCSGKADRQGRADGASLCKEISLAILPQHRATGAMFRPEEALTNGYSSQLDQPLSLTTAATPSLLTFPHTLRSMQSRLLFGLQRDTPSG